MGTLLVNLALLSGVSSIPEKALNSPVPVMSGQMLFTRI